MSGAVLTDEHRKARTAHTCSLCELRIEPGTTYRFYTYAGDGTVWTHHEHEACAALFYGEWWDGDEYDRPDPHELRQALADRSAGGA